jgi:hypothetical protein
MPAFFSSLLVLVCLHVFIWFLVALVDASTQQMLYLPQFSFNVVLLVLATVTAFKSTAWTAVFHWLLMMACIIVCAPYAYLLQSFTIFCLTQTACNLQKAELVLSIITLVELFIFWCYSLGTVWMEKKSIQKNQFNSIQFKVANLLAYASVCAFTFFAITYTNESIKQLSDSEPGPFSSFVWQFGTPIMYAQGVSIAMTGVVPLSVSVYFMMRGLLFAACLCSLLNFVISLPLFVFFIRSAAASGTFMAAVGLFTFLQLLTSVAFAIAAYHHRGQSATPRHSPAEEEERRSVV